MVLHCTYRGYQFVCYLFVVNPCDYIILCEMQSVPSNVGSKVLAMDRNELSWHERGEEHGYSNVG